MTEPDNTLIAGSKTCGDWRAFRSSLVPGGDPALWEAAFEDYFRARGRLRHFEPLAQDVYKNVRSGLPHEARTKNGWRTGAKYPTGAIGNATGRILFRDNFH